MEPQQQRYLKGKQHMNDSVGLYLSEIGTVPLLTTEEERQLSRRIDAGRLATAALAAGTTVGDEHRTIRDAARAKDHFIRANLRLVVSIARRYPMQPSLELLDLIQEGNLGLEHAVDKFDWRKGFKFSTYATFWIRQAIGRALDQKGSLVRLPGDRSAALRNALRRNGGDSEALDADLAELNHLTSVRSLDKTVGDDTSTELIDLLADTRPGPAEHLMADVERELLGDLLKSLDDRALIAVSRRFGLADGTKRSFREIGEELGLSAEAARRLVKRALHQVRRTAGESPAFVS